jgi:adenosylhomocysteine nucleosidase
LTLARAGAGTAWHSDAVPPPVSRPRVAVLTPMRQELAPLVRPLGLRGDGALLAGALGRLEVLAAVTGIGTRAAARTAERVLGTGGVDHLIVVGIAGGIGRSVAIGDLVVPELVLDRTTGAGHRPALLGEVAPRGRLLTSDGLLADPREAARLELEGVIAVDMETAAIAAICEQRGCPWSVFRGISDRADDGSVDEGILELAGTDGRGSPLAVARFVLARPWRVPQLARLARGLHAATRVAARAAVRALEGI